MLIELASLPQAVQEEILNADSLQIAQNGQVIKQYTAFDDEQAYYDWFYEHHFDVERLAQAIGETDENGCAKGIEVPKSALTDLASFDKWLAGAK